MIGTFETAILVTAAAGIGGTGLGGGAACLVRQESERMVSLLLSFAAGVMVSVVCFDLLTDAAAEGGIGTVAAGVLIGFGVTGGLNLLLERRNQSSSCEGEQNNLVLAGVVMALAIALHNMPEGMIIGAAFASGSVGSGWTMATVIALHNIPEGMAISVPLSAGGESPWKAMGIAALTGAPTVLGAVLGYCLGTMGAFAFASALSFASGAMLYVVFGELLPEASSLWKSTAPAFAVVAGILLGMMITST